jgi:hypothetical protein
VGGEPVADRSLAYFLHLPPPTPTLPHKGGGRENQRWANNLHLIQRNWGSIAVLNQRWLLRTLSPGLGQHTFDRDRLTALALARVGRFHEGIDLERFVGAHGGFAGLEELDDLD